MNIETANRLVELRKKNGLSQEDLANKLGLSRQAVSKWERREFSPDTDNLICLANLYNISLDELLNIDKNVKIHNSNVEKEKNLNINILDTQKTQYEELNNKEDQIDNNDNVNSVEEKDERKLTLRDRKVLAIVGSVSTLVAIIVYLILGSCLNKWHPAWIVILTPLVISSLADAIVYRKLERFAMPIFVVIIYLLLGFFLNLWHPGWVIFLLIPLYYSLAPLISLGKRRKNQKSESLK